MTATLRHRGPDGTDVWVDGATGLGHTRLAIRDLSDGGRQPMHDASGAVSVVFNGEIYNDRALRDELSRRHGVTFHTECDAEVIAPGWVAWGPALFDRLEGMFAIAICDRRTGQLILARDPIGIKPLYCRWDGAAVHFASELKGVLAAANGVRFSPPGIHQFLAEGFAGPQRTLVDGVQQVPPGTIWTIDRHGRHERRYWTPSRAGHVTSLDDAVDAFAALWPRVVDDMLISDVPVGLLLSSGIDSSLIAHVVRDSSRDAFTGKFPIEAWDESPHAESCARSLGLRHHAAPIDVDDNIESTFRRVVAHVDGQLADSSCLPFYKVCERARQVVPVLLSGDGADEFFGGYSTYRASQVAELVRPVLRPGLATPLSGMVRMATSRAHAPVSPGEKLWRFLAGLAVSPPGCAHVQWRRHLLADQQPLVYGPEMREVAATDPLGEYAGPLRSHDGTLLDRCLLADQHHYLPGDMLMKVDSMSMAHGLEIRVPFLDRRIMELAGQLSGRLLSRPGQPDKRVLRSALTRFGADASITRRPKRGFNMPVAFALRTGLRPLGQRLLDEQADSLAPWLNPDGVRHLWREHQSQLRDHGYALWTLLTLAEWKTSVA